MKHWIRNVALAVSLSLPFAAAAEPLDPATVPGDSKWVLHVDMDAVRKSATWKQLYDKFSANPGFMQKVTELENIFNARFPDDLHGVTLFGANFGDKTGVVVIDASVDRKQVEQLLAQNPKYNATQRGDQQVLTWDDKGETKYGAFFSDRKFMVSDDKDSVGYALDVLNGKAEALKGEAPLAEGVRPAASDKSKPGIMLYVAGEQLANLRRVQAARSPLLAQMKSAWITFGEEGRDLVLRLNVNADSAASAEKMKQAAEGLRAMLGLAAGDENAKPGVKTLAEVTQGATVTTKGAAVSLECKVPATQMSGLLDEAIKNNGK